MTRVLFSLLCLLLYSELQHRVDCSTSQEREQILQYVLAGGPSAQVRPDGAEGEGSPVVVHIGFSLLRIVHVDDVYGILRTAGYLFMSWSDPRLNFPRASRNYQPNVTTVRLDPSQIWTPDIEVYNTDSPAMKSMNQRDTVVANRSGEMLWVPMISFNSFCDSVADSSMDCTLRFGSWTYSGNDLDLQVPDEVDLSEYHSIGPWVVASSSVERVVKHYPCCPEPYLTAEYTYRLVRL